MITNQHLHLQKKLQLLVDSQIPYQGSSPGPCWQTLYRGSTPGPHWGTSIPQTPSLLLCPPNNPVRSTSLPVELDI